MSNIAGSDGRIASLDGIRALSISLVILGHLIGTTHYPITVLSPLSGSYAHLGVSVFFVISGFLITSLLLNEREKTGSIDLYAFYIRRGLRIMPAFLCFMLGLALADWCGWLSLSLHNYIYSLTYTVNYEIDRPWVTGHLWSLSVEEQFYLIWPAVFAWMGTRRALPVAVFMYLAGPVVRACMHWMFPTGPYRDLEIFPAVADAIAIGCILAILRPRLLANATYLRYCRPYLALFVLPLAYLVTRFDGYSWVDLIGTPVLLCGMALLIEAFTRHSSGLAGRVLNSRPLMYLGMLSYSLYLWQQPFLNRHAANAVNAFPTNILLALLLAVCSYTFVELPVLNLRQRVLGRLRPADRGLSHNT